MIFITGDTHGEWQTRFDQVEIYSFPEQEELTRDDYVIVCGDFGIWEDGIGEQLRLNNLEKYPFTILFVDGNHENADRLYSFPITTFHGGKVHKIRKNVYHLMRGEIYELCGRKFFAFGGASSHDIKDGILDIKDFDNYNQLFDKANEWAHEGKMFRINHISWWEEELPDSTEMENGWRNLENNNYEADYIITHSPYTSILRIMDGGSGIYQTDILTDYLQKVKEKVKYKKWFFGHMHVNQVYNFDNSMCLFENIIRLI